MKNLAIILLFMFATNYIQAQQNLIYNGDFELLDSCPTGPSTPGNLQIEYCLGWYSPTEGTSDYFNSCNSGVGINNASTPENFAGFQLPLNGEGYVGFYAYSLNTPPCNYKEYVQTKLIQPLSQGKKYKIELYVSLANNSTAAIEKIGLHFSNSIITKNNPCPIELTPQISSDNGFINDTLNWTKISDSFIAEGGEQYLTIGNFEELPILQPIVPDSISLGDYFVYYYIDAMLLEENNSIVIPNVLTPNGDGTNDYIDFYQLFGETNIAFNLYNRWGNKVFSTTDNKQKWSGNNTSGKPLSDGVYYYLINYDTPIKTIKGYIQIFNH